MVLSDLHKGNCAEIVRIDADKPLKDRLKSLGVMRGETLYIRECSLAKQTMEIEIDGSTHIALRAKEASTIEVKEINL
ncbi:MAG: FeoA family protein [Sulfurovum sp.]